LKAVSAEDQMSQKHFFHAMLLLRVNVNYKVFPKAW